MLEKRDKQYWEDQKKIFENSLSNIPLPEDMEARLNLNPSLLWNYACEYFEDTQSTPWESAEVLKGGEMAGTLVSLPKTRPYSWTGLRQYLRSKHVSGRFLEKIRKSTNEKFRAYEGVISAIEDVIYAQKFEGAAVGAFNANLMIRELGLSDKTEAVVHTESEIDVSALSDDELRTLRTLQNKAANRNEDFSGLNRANAQPSSADFDFSAPSDGLEDDDDLDDL